MTEKLKIQPGVQAKIINSEAGNGGKVVTVLRCADDLPGRGRQFGPMWYVDTELQTVERDGSPGRTSMFLGEYQLEAIERRSERSLEQRKLPKFTALMDRVSDLERRVKLQDQAYPYAPIVTDIPAQLAELSELLEDLNLQAEPVEVPPAPPEPVGIDWSEMPPCWVEVRDGGVHEWTTRWFRGVVDEGLRYRTDINPFLRVTVYWEHIRLIKGPPVPWFGGDCPLPDGVRIKIWCRGDDPEESSNPPEFDWGHLGTAGDIIAYQVLGEAE